MIVALPAAYLGSDADQQCQAEHRTDHPKEMYMRHLPLYLQKIFLPARCEFIVVNAVVGKLRTKGCDELTSMFATTSAAWVAEIVFSV
jgi:hypothetical protein